MPLKPKSKMKLKIRKPGAGVKQPDDKPITNKEISYAYIIRHMREIRPNPVVIAAIAGAKFRSNGNRLQKITDMILDNSAKATKRMKALLEKRGHGDIALVNIDTSTLSNKNDTSARGVPDSDSVSDDDEEEREDGASEGDDESEDD